VGWNVNRSDTSLIVAGVPEGLQICHSEVGNHKMRWCQCLVGEHLDLFIPGMALSDVVLYLASSRANIT
jgi:hypothetical protein